MAISTFGGVAANTNNTVSGTIGAPLLAPVGFTSPSYVDTGATFNPSTYPQLAACYPAAFYADIWKTASSPTGLNSLLSSQIYGNIIGTVVWNNEFYVFFAKGHVFKTTGGSLSSLAFYKQVTLINATVNNIQVAGGYLYFIYGSAQIQVFTEPTMSSSSIASGFYMYSGTVAYGNGVWVIGNTLTSTAGNTIYRSTDGITWSIISGNSTSQIWCGLAFGNGLFVMVSKTTGTTSCITSVDGSTWTARTGPATAPTGSLVYNSTLGLFATVTGSTTSGVYTSPDGITWTARSTPSVTPGTTINCTSTGVFYTYNTSNASGVLVSTDGINWTNRTSTITGAATYSSMFRLTSYGSNFYAIGAPAASNTLYASGSSTDNLATLQNNTTTPALNTNPNLFPPMNVGGTFVTFENIPNTTIPNAPQYAYSTDSGNTWSLSTLPVGNIAWRGAFATPTKFIIWGVSTNLVTVLSSADGVNWTTKTLPLTGAQGTTTVGCFFNETLYFAVGQTIIATTDYGNSFISSLLPTSISTATSLNVNYYGVLQLLISTGGAYFSLTNGVSWQTGISPALASSTVGPYCTGPKASMCVAISASATAAYFMTLDNGQTWQQLAFPVAISSSVKSAMYVNGYYIVYLGNSSYYYSTDCINWTSMSTGATAALNQPWNQAAVSNGVAFICGSTTNYLIGDTTTYHVPFIPSTIAGTKYVVRAQ